LILITNRIIKMKINIKHKYKLLLLFLSVAFIAFGFLGDDKNGVQSPKPIYKISSTQESGKQGDAYGMNVNNVWMPINSKGIIAAVNVPPNGSGGQFAGGTFLFSGGFMLSGYSEGTLWANAVASASLVEDYLPGPVGQTGNSNAVVYVVNSQDEPFGQSWQDWADAVDLGADFYDGNGDGIYTPSNTNGIEGWQPDEDAPDLIGDEMVWCIYNDAVPIAQRRWNTTIQVGLEIKQSVFAFASAGAIGNLIFIRYRFAYKGLNASSPDSLTQVYFGAWADPDLGDSADDVVGVDTVRNAGYTYNNTPDAVYGSQVPCFMIDFFSGPRAYIAGETYIDNGGIIGEYDEGIDTPIDTATSVQGQLKGVVYYPGAKNLPISSFVFYGNGLTGLSDPNDKDEARFYTQGLTSAGEEVDPCSFAFGEVKGGVDCHLVDPRFWFSGDPVTNVGWICTENRDMRQMTNTGPFVLEKDAENEIVLAYVVGRGTTPLNGITVSRAIDDGAQTIFDLNFLAPSPPPPVQFTLTSSDDFIDIQWDTPNQVKYENANSSWSLLFEGYQVWAFRTNVAEDFISGQPNSELIAYYDKHNFIENVYVESSENGGKFLVYPWSPANQLDSAIFADPQTGRIRLRIYNDPFESNQPIIKGKPYYFAVTSYAINYDALVYKDDPTIAVGDTGDYYLNSFAFAQGASNIRTISSIVAGVDQNNPPISTIVPANRIRGASSGNVGYDIVDVSALTDNQYEVTFFKDSSSELYNMYWRLASTLTDSVYIDSSDTYIYTVDSVATQVVDGFIPNVENITTSFGTPQYSPASSVWYTDFDFATDGTGAIYVGRDVPPNDSSVGKPTLFPGQLSTAISANEARRVELRFGETGVGKAYRYINGYKGGVFSSALAYTFAGGITASDTVGKGVIGNWNTQTDRPNGWVDVPFTAWLVDPNFSNDEIQLAVGFLERRNTATFPNGTPDGIWDPTDSLIASGEYIYIFNTPYDPNGGQMEYTGGAWNTPSGPDTVWSDLVKGSAIFAKKIPEDAIGVTEEQRNIFNSPYFNTMYTVGFQRLNSNSFYTIGDELVIPVALYPYTESDIYQFMTSTSTTTSSQQQDMWNKVNVYPNPLYGYNELSSYYTNTPDEPYVTFTNLPEQITIKIYSLSGSLLKTLTTDDKASPTSPFLNWNLLNESGLRVASGMYLAIVSSPIYGDKTLKFAIIMPQKQIQRF
jgi:hypothetical protein